MSRDDKQTREATKKLQAQVEEVIDIMVDNLEKLPEREIKLKEIDNRADELAKGAKQFRLQGEKLRRKAWWKNAKSWVLSGCVIVIIVVIIIVIIST